MQVAILSARTGWHTDELCRALAVRGHSWQVVPYEHLIACLGGRRGHHARSGHHARRPGPLGPGNEEEQTSASGTSSGFLHSDGVSLLDAGAVLARIIPAGSLEQIIYRVDALHWLEERGVAVLNSPRAIERSVDKFYTDTLLATAGLRTPETMVCEGIDEAMEAVRAMGDVVIKPLFGSMGHGLVRVSDPDTALRVIRALAQVRAVFYVQRAIEHRGRDIRAFVVGDRVIGAIERIAPPEDWRSNVSRGGTARVCELSSEWADLAVRAASAIGADYAGVDLLPDVDGSVFVLEVNGIPGWRGLQTATGIDVAGTLIDYLIARTTHQGQASEIAR
jgi:RimK family alpha-L-glutamate ligase